MGLRKHDRSSNFQIFIIFDIFTTIIPSYIGETFYNPPKTFESIFFVVLVIIRSEVHVSDLAPLRFTDFKRSW